jgi:hypothetical protein
MTITPQNDVVFPTYIFVCAEDLKGCCLFVRDRGQKATMVSRIVSGGQTGVDPEALDFAMRNGIRDGGYCPKGRRSTWCIPTAR